MYNLHHILFRSLFYIGLLSPFVFIACCVIICSSQYLKQKSERNQKVNNSGKKYKKQNQSNCATYSVTSGSSTQSLLIEVENPNKYSYQLEDKCSKRNNSLKNSVKTSFVNLPGKRYFKYLDSMLLLPETGQYENASEDEIHVSPDHLHLKNESNDSHKQVTAPKLSMEHIYSKYGDIQENIYNSNPKKCKCTESKKKPYTAQSKVKIQDQFTGNMNFDNASLSVDPVESVQKINRCKDKLHDGELKILSLKNASKHYRKAETDILNEKFQQCDFGNNHEYSLAETNESPQFNTNEKCQLYTISKENNFVSEIQKTECVPQSNHNPHGNNKHHKDFPIPVFQNRNIPIAKKVLEDEQFYDLRQKFYGAENIFQNASNPKQYQPNLNTLNKTKQTYQFDEKLHSQKIKQHFVEESTKDSYIQHEEHNINVMEETVNENQIIDGSSTTNSTENELLCQFWKSLKSEAVGQKKNKSVQTKVPYIEQNNDEFSLEKYATKSNDYYKKFQSAIPHIELKQDIIKQAENTTAKKSVYSIQDECTQTCSNEKQCILPKQLSQSQDEEHCSQIQPFSTQIPNDIGTIENKMCRNCQILLSPAGYSKKRVKPGAIEPMTLYTRPTMMQAEFQHTCLEPLQHNAQLIENTENYQCSYNNHLRPNFRMNYKNMCNICNADFCLQNENNYVCNQMMLLNDFQNKQSLNPNNNIRVKRSQNMHFEYGNMPFNNPNVNAVQSGQYDKYKHIIPSMEKMTNNRNEYTHQQRGNRRHWLNCESFTKDQYSTNNGSTNNFYNQPSIIWRNENISQKNEIYDKHINMQNEDNLTHPLPYNYKNNKSQTHNIIETDIKGIQPSEETTLSSSNHEKHCNTQHSKEKVNKSNSKTEIGREDLEKSTADQKHPKQNVEKMRIIKRMYPQIDQNIHEKNKNVINEVKSVLQKTGKWQSG